MSISTITIGGNNYTSYASVAEADIYLAVDPVRASTWSGLTTDQKGTNLIAATRRLDMLNWQGEKTGAEGTQINDWPRTNVEYPDGTAVSTSEVPQEVEDATILLAGTIAIDSTSSQTSSSSTVSSITTSTSSIRYFAGGSKAKAVNRLQDESAYELIKIFLAGSQFSIGVGVYSGGKDSDGEYLDSLFEDQDQWDRNEGYS